MPEIAVTGWKELRLALGEHLRPDGPEGFEGLLARMFAAETGQPFYLARTGDQPAGDVYGPLSGIALQAKRYTAATIDANNVEGDIDRALRETEGTDIFIVAATRADNQLKLRLEKKTNETGVDLVLLALDDGITPLGAICVKHWKVLREFLPNLDAASDRWAEAQMFLSDTVLALEQFRAELSGLPTRITVSAIAGAKLRARLEGGYLGNASHNRVNIADAIPRPRYRRLLQNWWTATGATIAILEGEEGTGKTWVGADFANMLAEEASVVLWLDSLAWCRAITIEEVILTALQTLYPPSDKRPVRIARKIFRRWPEPVLVLLDGANEREAWGAAERLLNNYRQYGTEIASRVRLLFTSRPLQYRPGVGRHFWGDASIIPIEPFDDTEFSAAMGKFAPDVSPETLTSSVRELARVPRYFRLCLQLREKLASFDHLNRQILLWADLDSKLDRGDPQWLGMERELGANGTEILAHLAEQIGWPEGETTTVTTAELNQYLPGLEKARNDLRDQRIVVTANLQETLLSAEHLVLGWALVLQRTAEVHATEDADTLCDRLQRLLEPAASNDDKARAVHVAALLTFLKADAAAGAARAALLRLWTLHHNANVTPEALTFFVREDLNAYCAAVQAFFRTHLPGNFETTLITPLAAHWRKSDADNAVLRHILERWLRLIFPGDATGSYDRAAPPPSRYIAADTVEQLRLSYTAASIISFRPEFGFIPALADCFRSDEFCYADHGTSENPMRFPNKSSRESLGLLARWHYGEAAIPELIRFLHNIPTESEDWKKMNDFARLWRLATLPSPIGSVRDIMGDGDPKDDAAQLEYFRSAVGNSTSPARNIIGADLFGRLAIRIDLKTLTSTEIELVVNEVDTRLALPRLQHFDGSLDGRPLDDLMPYLARYSREAWARAVQRLWLTAIESPGAWQLFFRLAEWLPGSDPDGLLVRTAIASFQDRPDREHLDICATPITELMLFHADAHQLQTWLSAIATVTVGSSASLLVNLSPLPTALENLAPPGFEEIARSEFQRALRDVELTHTKEAITRASHWLQVFAYASVTPSREIAEWALDLADRYKDNENFRFPLFHIVCRCSDAEILRRGLCHPAFEAYSVGFNAWRWALAFKAGAWPMLSWADLKTCTTFTVAGWLLSESGQEEELCKWGRDFAAAALEALSVTPTPLPQTQIEVRVGEHGRVDLTTFVSPPGGHDSWMSTSSPAWGVDRQRNRPSPTQADADEMLDAFHADLQKLQTSARREFVNFNAAGPLGNWSRVEPERFAAWAEDFLARAAGLDFAAKHEMAYFLETVATALLRLRPESVVGKELYWSAQPISRIVGCGGLILMRKEVLWEPELDSSELIAAERRRLLLEAPDDEKILWQVMAAHARQNPEAIAALADEWLRDAMARERALAISILAFHGDGRYLQKLRSVIENDQSFWVRDHARWALDVCASESICRQRYGELLEASSLEQIVSGLAELQPALSPMAFAWREAPEYHSRLMQQTQRNRTAIQLFWAHWGSSSSSRKNISLGLRKIEEFCRGEPLKDGVTSHMAPWWSL